MSSDAVKVVLSADVADGGTMTVGYPDGRSAGSYTGGHDHYVVGTLGRFGVREGTASFSFGASSVTVTNKSGATWPSGSELWVNLDMIGEGLRVSPADEMVVSGTCAVISLGSPDALDADGVCAAQAVSGAGDLTINGALASGGVATMDVARGLQAVSSNAGDTTQTLTITGTDHYGETVVETITLNGTTAVSGKKAFRTVTKVTASAGTTGNVSVGTTDVIGLPVFLPGKGFVLSEISDGAKATAATAVAGDSATATATTDEVRRTYNPNAACNGSKSFQLVVALGDVSYAGVKQYAG